MRLLLCCLTFVVIVLGSVCCAPTPIAASPSSSSPSPPFQGLWRHPQEPRLFGWVSSPWTFSTTSWAIEGDDGLVLIDTQFLASDGAAFVDAVEGATGKRAVLAVVLHANPDKFNGTATLQARGIRVVTSPEVSALIPEVHARRVRAFADRYGTAYPRALPAPEIIAARTVEAAGVSLGLTTMGPGCSAAHLVAVWEGPAGRHLFAGDLVAEGSHAWLEIGATDRWLQRLDELAALQPTFVHPGRGLSAPASTLARQRAYLQTVIDAVGVARAAGGDDDAIVAGARAAIVARYPALRFAVFLEIGLPAELRRQRSS